MIRRALLALLLPLPLLAPSLFAPSLLAQTTVRGIVTEQNSGNRPIPGVQIKVLGCVPELSDNAGAFAITCAAKKPGDRIIATEVAKAGYEIVNKEAVSNWLVPSDAAARTKIVMCPEGALARNILKYYDISSAALTRGYNETIRRLQAQRDSARIDAATYGRQAQAATTRYEAQQKQLEELAERFARENFDDCSDVHRRAFAAFSSGDVDDAIRILESVNSLEEIGKAKAQREKGARMAEEGNAMQAESGDVIRQNLEKLLFQAALYEASNRYDDAGRTYENAASADSSFFPCVWAASKFFYGQNDPAKALRWGRAALAAARAPFDSARALKEVGRVLERHEQRGAEAEPLYQRSLNIMRQLAEEDPRGKSIHVADLLSYLAVLHTAAQRYAEAEEEIVEALGIQRTLMEMNRTVYASFVAASLLIHAGLQCRLIRCAEGEAMYLEAIEIARSLPDSASPGRRFQLHDAYIGLASLMMHLRSFARSEQYTVEALRYARLLRESNPEAYADLPAKARNNLAAIQCKRRNFPAAVENQRACDAVYDSLARVNPRRFLQPRLLYILNLPSIYDEWGKPDSAVLLYGDAMATIQPLYEADPATYDAFHLSVLFRRGLALWHAGRYDSADVQLNAALLRMRTRAREDSVRSWPALAQFLFDLANGTYAHNLPRAIACMEETLEYYHRNEHGPIPLKVAIARICSQLAKFMILARRFADAEAYARQAHEYGTVNRTQRYLAPALLYLGRYDEARALYASFANQEYDELQTFREALLADLDEFEQAGLTHPDAPKIRALLTQTQEPPK